jgi:phospholipid-transporting ATPase
MKKKKNDDTPRLIYINNSELNEQQKFITNAISTGKYNAFSFLPKFLYEEFRKAANLFFLFISCIQVGYQKE